MLYEVICRNVFHFIYSNKCPGQQDSYSYVLGQHTLAVVAQNEKL